ncbi:MAG TPA: DEAD/DEAH box helicase [Fibrobacteria bacterium]|nr:DEAD/DEAH box helicase [Fibrobacteria bacterium]
MSKVAFTSLSLSKEVLKSIEEMGFETATAIQGEAIPPIVEGRDVIGQSGTGTGKTIAFAVPAVEKIDTGSDAVQVLVLCPTRELCIQVAEQIGKLGKHKKNLRALPIYGGQAYDRQLFGLKRGAHIVIGTPGRLIDHLERGSLKLDKVKLVVLDEADEMLDMGFQEDLEKIVGRIPAERQTVLFSATMQPGIKRLAQAFLKNPLMIKSTPENLTVPAIEQAYMEVQRYQKAEALSRVLDFHRVKLGIVFCNTRIGVDELVEHLQARGYSAEGLHGEHKQAMRDRIMAKFRNGTVEILVATDVASRGIDVKDVEMVVNYDLPKDEEDYVHRIGRTGRAGKKGLALSFASGKDIFRLRNIERFSKIKIARRPVPTLDQVESAQHSVVLDKVRETLAAGGLERFHAMVDTLIEGEVTASDVAAAMLKLTLPEAPAREPEAFNAGREGGGFDPRDRKGHDRDGRNERGPRDRGGYNDRPSRSDNVMEDRPKREWKDKPASKDMAGFEGASHAKLFINVGKIQGVRPKDILGALAGETGIPGKAFGNIDVKDKHTIAEVPEDSLETIVAVFKKVRIKGVPVKARRAEF